MSFFRSLVRPATRALSTLSVRSISTFSSSIRCDSSSWYLAPAVNLTDRKDCKPSTHLVGLPVVPNAREVLIGLYKETIRAATEYGTEGKKYNEVVIKLSKYRLAICEKFEKAVDIEREIRMGIVEELISQAENELDLLVVMNEEHKPWEVNPEAEKEWALFAQKGFGEEPDQVNPWNFIEKGEDEQALWKEIDEKITQSKQ